MSTGSNGICATKVCERDVHMFGRTKSNFLRIVVSLVMPKKGTPNVRNITMMTPQNALLVGECFIGW